jgi:hypothetical protein
MLQKEVDKGAEGRERVTGLPNLSLLSPQTRFLEGIQGKGKGDKGTKLKFSIDLLSHFEE